MMLRRFIPFLVAANFLSCEKNLQKNIIPLLARMETTSGGETVTTTIQYNDGKPILMQALGFSGGGSINVTTRVIRNSQGIIEKIIIKNPAYLTTFFADSIVYAVNYSTANSRYTSLVNYLFFKSGTTEYDSTYFSYDGANVVTQATKLINNGSSSGHQEAERNEFTYDNGNLIRCKNYIFSSLFLEQSVSYDNKINPMGFGKEWILIGSTRNNRKFEQSSPNNATTVSFNRSGVISTTTTTYTYNLNNLPASKTELLSNGSTQISTFYYQ
jgi:hypothetical protein